MAGYGWQASAGLLRLATYTVVELTVKGGRVEDGHQWMKCVPCAPGAHDAAGQGCRLRDRLAQLTLLSPSTRVDKAAEGHRASRARRILHASRLWHILASSYGPRQAIRSLRYAAYTAADQTACITCPPPLRCSNPAVNVRVTAVHSSKSRRCECMTTMAACGATRRVL